MTPKHTSDEIVKFLEYLQGTSPGLPDAVVGHWQEAVAICKEIKPDWDKAIYFCNSISTILSGLRGGEVDFREVDQAQGQVSILLGAINLGQEDGQAASYYFKQAAKHLRHWGPTAFESLAYFGQALAHKQEQNWVGALEAAQKALGAIHNLPVPHKSKHTKGLHQQIEDEIHSITEESKKTAAKAPSAKRLKPFTPPPPDPIPIVSDIAAGLGVIAEENIQEYLFLDDSHRNGADFGVNVVGDSMKDSGILPGDIALIRQQPGVDIGEIAAMVIVTPLRSDGVLKRYHQAYEEQADLFHWFLKSSNPSSEHLVVIPSDADVSAIKAKYDEAIRSGRISNPVRYYENAELAIAGKYVGLLRQG